MREQRKLREKNHRFITTKSSANNERISFLESLIFLGYIFISVTILQRHFSSHRLETMKGLLNEKYAVEDYMTTLLCIIVLQYLCIIFHGLCHCKDIQLFF